MRPVLRSAAALTICGAALAFAAPASAASYAATDATLAAVFASATDGDTIVLSGSFGTTLLAGRNFATPLRIDARNAQFGGTLTIRDMHGLSINGGRYGSPVGSWQNGNTIRVEDSDMINFTNPKLTADGLGKARGLSFARTSNFSVTGGSFSGFRVALGGTAMTNGLFENNRIVRSTSDGIDIVDSHFVTARGNSCAGGHPSAGAHPDCIQLWSLAGNPVQSDIQILNNTAKGYTQGFTSFDPERGGGLRISIIGNRVDTSLPQGIACYGCVDSIITDNVLTTLPGANHRTYLRVVGGSNNIVANNSIGPFPPVAPAAASRAAAATFEPSTAAVPEPTIWVQLIGGFAALGGLLRRRRLHLSCEVRS